MKYLIAITLFLGVILACNSVSASVVGSWSVTGTETTCVKKGPCQTVPIMDYFTFLPNGVFTSFETNNGKWTQKKSKFQMQIDSNEFREVLERYLEGTGIQILSMDAYSFKGTEISYSQISGVGSIKKIVVQNSAGKKATLTVKSQFTGTKDAKSSLIKNKGNNIKVLAEAIESLV